MTPGAIYLAAGAALAAIGLYGLAAGGHTLRRILALNLMSSGVFLLLIASGWKAPGQPPDAVPQALVLTGIVVSVSATALALALAVRIQRVTKQTQLPEDTPS